MNVRKQTQGSHRRINVQPCGEAGSNHYRQDFIAGKGKHFLTGTKTKRLPKQPFRKPLINKQLTAYSRFQNPRLPVRVLVCTCCFYFYAPTRGDE